MKYHSLKSVIFLTLIGIAVTVGLVACGGGGSSGGGGGSSPSTAPQMTITSGFPRIVPARNPPQASGTNIPDLFIAGSGSTSSLTALNNTGTALSVHVGSWFEPTDGEAQRMIVTETTLLPHGQVVRIPAAGRQRSKSTPANGLRFFSQHKQVSTSFPDICQRSCLARSSGVQDCVWGCESANPQPQPPSGSTGTGRWSAYAAAFNSMGLHYNFIVNADSADAARSLALSECNSRHAGSFRFAGCSVLNTLEQTSPVCYALARSDIVLVPGNPGQAFPSFDRLPLSQLTTTLVNACNRTSRNVGAPVNCRIEESGCSN